jgi:Flp pilus assembly pilin Flp
VVGKSPTYEGENMKTLKNLIRDDRGGEVLEYALIAGLIVVAAIAIIASTGTTVLARWTSVYRGL